MNKDKAKGVVRRVKRKLPGELMHRAASYVIVVEAVVHWFGKILPAVGAGVVFIVVEVIDAWGESED